MPVTTYVPVAMYDKALADLAAERARADKETKYKKEFERDWLDACDQLDAMKKDRNRLRAAIEKALDTYWIGPRPLAILRAALEAKS